MLRVLAFDLNQIVSLAKLNSNNVRININSEPLSVNMGIPQDSTLGPVLFYTLQSLICVLIAYNVLHKLMFFLLIVEIVLIIL